MAKRKFEVEIDYEESAKNIIEKSPVITNVGIECAIENMMYGYACTQNISLSHGYTIDVTEVN